MTAMSGSDFPMFVQIPKNKIRFSLISVMNIFKDETQLRIDVDLENKEYGLFLDKKDKSTKLGLVKP